MNGADVSFILNHPRAFIYRNHSSFNEVMVLNIALQFTEQLYCQVTLLILENWIKALMLNLAQNQEMKNF